MIRPSLSSDAAAIIALAIETELFGAEETEPLAQVLADYFAGRLDAHQWVSDEEGGEMRGAAYFAPAPFSDGAWDLLMIAVKPGKQRQGTGTALIRHVETTLQESGQRILLVDTSGLPSYERARAFYVKCGFEEEARIRDFYKAGDDKVVFRKAVKAG